MSFSLELQEVSADVWPLFQDSNGRVLDEYSVRKWTFFKGVSTSIRAEVWLFLLGYYPFKSTREGREAIDKDRREKYEALVQRSCNGLHDDPAVVLKLHNYQRIIDKDCLRTDRHLAFYSNTDDVNMERLREILNAFIVYDPEMGYVQGMNDLLSPFLLLFNSEHKAFWCFTEVIKRTKFLFLDLTLSQPLRTVARLCCYGDKQLHDHIDESYDGEDWVFCYRWILLLFKRELEMPDMFRLWEAIWSNHSTCYFQLFFAAALLIHKKRDLLQCKSVEGCMEFMIGQSCAFSLAPVLRLAQSLLEQLKSDEYCPYELRYLVSSEGCAPPPLVGFVRARQKFSTLHSNKIALQRNAIWTSLFGDAPVQPITSPFMLSPLNDHTTCHTSNGHIKYTTAEQQTERLSKVSNYAQSHIDRNCHMHIGFSPTSPVNLMVGVTLPPVTIGVASPPPTFGFIPRDNEIKVREDIRISAQHSPALLNGSNSTDRCDVNMDIRTGTTTFAKQQALAKVTNGSVCQAGVVNSKLETHHLVQQLAEVSEAVQLQLDCLRSEAELYI